MPPNLRCRFSWGGWKREQGRMEFHELLARYRRESLSEAQKGTKFEQLMRAYLLALPRFKGLFAKV